MSRECEFAYVKGFFKTKLQNNNKNQNLLLVC